MIVDIRVQVSALKTNSLCQKKKEAIKKRKRQRDAGAPNEPQCKRTKGAQHGLHTLDNQISNPPLSILFHHLPSCPGKVHHPASPAVRYLIPHSSICRLEPAWNGQDSQGRHSRSKGGRMGNLGRLQSTHSSSSHRSRLIPHFASSRPKNKRP